MQKAIKVGIMGAGGWVGSKMTTAIEQAILKQNPKNIIAAPAVTAVVGIAGSVMLPDENMAAFADGVSVWGMTELLLSAEAAMKAKKNGNGNGNDTGKGTGNGEQDAGNINKNLRHNPVRKGMPSRMNMIRASNIRVN